MPINGTATPSVVGEELTYSLSRFYYLNLWYGGLDLMTTDKDQLDFAALMDPDIKHLIKISAIGLEVWVGTIENSCLG